MMRSSGGWPGASCRGMWGSWGLAALSSWWVLNGLALGLLLALLVLRRLRHLIVSFILAYLVVTTAAVVGASIRRPRPFGVDIQAGWGGWALPSQQVMFLAGLLVAILYTLVPRALAQHRQVGGRRADHPDRGRPGRPGRRRPHRRAGRGGHRGGPAAGRLPHAHPQRGLPGHLPARPQRPPGRHRGAGGGDPAGLEQQLGLVVQDIKPFGLSGSAGSTPLRITVKGADGEDPAQLFAKLYAQSHLRADRSYKLGRELLYGRLEDEKPFNTVRRLVQQEDYALRMPRRQPAHPRPHGVVELTPNASTCWSPSSSPTPSSWARPRSPTRSSTTASRSSAGSGRPGWPTATSSRPTCWSATARCC